MLATCERAGEEENTLATCEPTGEEEDTLATCERAGEEENTLATCERAGETGVGPSSLSTSNLLMREKRIIAYTGSQPDRNQ